MIKCHTLEEIILAAFWSAQADFEGSLDDIAKIVVERGALVLDTTQSHVVEGTQKTLDRVLLNTAMRALRKAYYVKYQAHNVIFKEHLESCLKTKLNQ